MMAEKKLTKKQKKAKKKSKKLRKMLKRLKRDLKALSKMASLVFGCPESLLYKKWFIK